MVAVCGFSGELDRKCCHAGMPDQEPTAAPSLLVPPDMRGPVCCGWDPGLFGGRGFPIPKDCECVTFHGKRDFTDVNKLKMLRWGDDSGLFVWA